MVGMKAILPILLLATLVSCNENMKRSTIVNNDSVVNQYKSGLKVDRGIVAIVDKAGTEPSVDQENKKLISNRVSERSKSIIIHVDGDNVYRYVEVKNNISGSMTKKVILENMNPEQELKDILNSNHGLISGDLLVLKNSGMDEYQDNNYSYNSVVNNTLSFNLNHSLCDYTTRVTQDASLKYVELDEQTISTTVNETAVCGQKYNLKQIKDINLKNILFCSDNDGNETCTMNDDLSWLTSDINL